MPANRRSSQAPLSAREVELAELVARGYPSKEIASRLTIAPDTVKTHLRNIFRKCKVRNRAELATWWCRNGQALAERVPIASGCATQPAEVRGWKVAVPATVLLAVIILIAAITASSRSSDFQGVVASDVLETLDVGATYWSHDGREVIKGTAAVCEQTRPEGGIADLYSCPTSSVAR